MASKGGVIAVSAIVGLGALFAFAATAKASPKGVPTKAEQDEKNLCTASKAERQVRLGTIKQLKGALVDIDAARIEIAMNGGDTTELDNQRASIMSQINVHQNRVNQLDGLIAACE